MTTTTTTRLPVCGARQEVHLRNGRTDARRGDEDARRGDEEARRGGKERRRGCKERRELNDKRTSKSNIHQKQATETNLV